jgi:hypothetical protein
MLLVQASSPTPTPFINETSFPMAKVGNISILMNVITPLLMGGGAILFLIILFQAAFKWLTSEGKPEELAKAQKTLIWGIVGFVIVISAYTLVKIIAMALNVSNQILP